jgi:hypothetical protein
MAAEPKPLCVFCEDGVPCPNRQALARRAVTASPATLLVPPVMQTRKPRNPNHPWRGIASLHLSDKAPAKPTTTAGVAPLQDEGRAGIDEVSTVGKDRQEEKEITVKPKTDEEIPRYCGRDGCTKTLTRANKSGFCTKHFYDSKKSGRAPGRPATNGDAAAKRGSKATPPRNSAARVETPATGIATICVTEAHMDNFWSKLSLEEKANLFQRQLEGA